MLNFNERYTPDDFCNRWAYWGTFESFIYCKKRSETRLPANQINSVGGLGDYYFNHDKFTSGVFCSQIEDYNTCVSYQPCQWAKLFFDRTAKCRETSGWRTQGNDYYCVHWKDEEFCEYDSEQGFWKYKPGLSDGQFCHKIDMNSFSCSAFYVCEPVWSGHSATFCQTAAESHQTTTQSYQTTDEIRVDLEFPAFGGHTPSISGYSSGGWTTSLFHMIYSEDVKHVAMGGNDRVLVDHSGFAYPTKEELNWYYSEGKIQNPQNIADSRVFFMFGEYDNIGQIQFRKNNHSNQH